MSRSSEAQGSTALDLVAGVVAAAVLAMPEIALVGGGPRVAFVIAALFLLLGLGVGSWLALARVTSARPGVGPWRSATIYAAGSLFATVPMARSLFEGAFAATLPGARFGHVWVPLVALAALACVIRVVAQRVEGASRARALALALVVLVGMTDWINRNVQRTEYPDIHAFLLVVEVVGLAIAIRLVAPFALRSRRARGGAGLLGGVVLIASGFAIDRGLQERDDRWAIATHGMHGRMLVRVVRLALDGDGDDSSPFLGGGDCDDSDPEIHPSAREIAGNDIDENCDGVVASAEVVLALETATRERALALDEWRKEPAVAQLLARTPELNVLIFTVDALRADVLADTPDNRAAYPNLFALLDESRAFAYAFAPSAGTDLSMSGLLTGRVDPFVSDVVPLFEAIAGPERPAFAVIPSEVIRYVGKAILTRGLAKWERLVNDKFERDVGSYTTSQRTTELGLLQLAEHTGAQPNVPWRLWLHYFDVHEHDEVKPSDRNLRRLGGEGTKPTRAEKYRLLVRLVDEQLGEVRRVLVERGQWDRTLVVIASDHGEGLGEDPRLPENHGRFLYNALVHVPLAIRIPGVSGQRIDTPVSLLDVYPTLLELCGAPAVQSDGASLLPFLVEGAPPALTDATRPLPLNETDQFGVLRWPDKLLVRREDNLVELYDLSTDFAERSDRSTTDPTRVAELLALVSAMPTVEIDRTRAGRRKREQAVAGD